MWNAHQIRTAPFIWEEIITQSRKLNAWNVYRKLSTAVIRKRMRNEESSSSSDDNSSDNKILKWSNTDIETKKSCEIRANRLNSREVAGEINDIFGALHITPKTDECNEDALLRTMQRLTSLEIKRSMKIFHNIITQGRRSKVCRRNITESNKCYYWGKEYIRTGTQIYNAFYLSPFAIECLFGPNFNRLKSDEIITKTKKTCLMHIHSQARFCELMKVGSASFGEAETREHTNYYCGKVIIKYEETGRTQVCYIIDENTEGFVSCISRGGARLDVVKPLHTKGIGTFNYGKYNELTQYDTEEATAYLRYTIIEYHPIRILVTSGYRNNFKILTNRYVRMRLESMDSIVADKCTCEYSFYFSVLTDNLF